MPKCWNGLELVSEILKPIGFKSPSKNLQLIHKHLILDFGERYLPREKTIMSVKAKLTRQITSNLIEIMSLKIQGLILLLIGLQIMPLMNGQNYLRLVQSK